MNEYPPDENPPCCPACGTPWQDHDGASQTCKALSAARARIAELEAKCERLHRTRDGAIATPDMELCCFFTDGSFHKRIYNPSGGPCDPKYWYSTESAALAAKESTNGT